MIFDDMDIFVIIYNSIIGETDKAYVLTSNNSIIIYTSGSFADAKYKFWKN